jgi:hypothetical protein
MTMNIVPSSPRPMNKHVLNDWIFEFRRLGRNMLVATYDIEDETLEAYAKQGYSTVQTMAKLKGFGAYDIIEEDE